MIEYFGETGLGDKKFNTLHGDRQMCFTTADGVTSVDVIMDKLNMCHVLEFADRIDRMPDTLDVADLLLSKLQVVELNPKDVHDILHLLSAFEVREGDEPARSGPTDRRDRRRRLGMVADGHDEPREGRALRRRGALGHGPGGPHAGPGGQAQRLRQHCDDVPKPMKWKLRAKVGDRVQWFQEPEEVGH